MKIAIIGGGPAGLRAAESIAESSHSSRFEITLFDAKPSVGRKFLVAGKGGLNITKNEPPEVFHTRLRAPEAPAHLWRELISEHSPEHLRSWAASLGIGTFVASTGRVYPDAMKAAPLLRRWVARLKGQGVSFAMHHRWVSWEALSPSRGEPRPTYLLRFQTPAALIEQHADAVVLAMGGASWPQTGSDGAWLSLLEMPPSGGTPFRSKPFSPANCGWELAWDNDFLALYEGKPLKNIIASAGDTSCPGELMITRYGLEGGALYQLGPELRAMEAPLLELDLKPSASAALLISRFGALPRRLPSDLLEQASRRWKLTPIVASLLQQKWRASTVSTPAEALAELAGWVKRFPLALTKPRPIAEAISSAGGLCWSELDSGLMLRRAPGIFAAGEMVDWEAPTGGYLLQGAFATGHRAGCSVVKYLSSSPTQASPRDGAGH